MNWPDIQEIVTALHRVAYEELGGSVRALVVIVECEDGFAVIPSFADGQQSIESAKEFTADVGTAARKLLGLPKGFRGSGDTIELRPYHDR